MSSLYRNNNRFRVSKLVDGLYDLRTKDEDSMAHTDNERNAWMQIDLGEGHCIRAVKIWNRRNYRKYQFGMQDIYVAGLGLM